MLEGKVEAAYQTILHIAKDKNFKGLKMAIIWKLSGNMHHPNNNIWSRKQNNNTQRKSEDTNNHEQHHKKNPPSTTINTK